MIWMRDATRRRHWRTEVFTCAVTTPYIASRYGSDRLALGFQVEGGTTVIESIRIVGILAAAATASTATAAPNPGKTNPAAAYAALPLSFEMNLGQADPATQFLWHGNGCSLMLTR